MTWHEGTSHDRGCRLFTRPVPLPDVFSYAGNMMPSFCWSHRRLGVRHSVGVRRLGTERVTTNLKRDGCMRRGRRWTFSCPTMTHMGVERENSCKEDAVRGALSERL